MTGRKRQINWRQGTLALGTLLSFVVSASLLQASGANASDILSLPSPTSRAATGLQTTAPLGWMQFCRDYAGDARNPCYVPALPAAQITLDAASWQTLNAVNDAVNREIEPITDLEHWGLVDKWNFPDDKKGDCEDYVIEKRQRLLEAGFPRQALLITVVRDKTGDGHAVLTIKTDRGDFILDNEVETILPWNKTGFLFIKRQSQENPNTWLKIKAEPPGPILNSGAAFKKFLIFG